MGRTGCAVLLVGAAFTCPESDRRACPERERRGPALLGYLATAFRGGHFAPRTALGGGPHFRRTKTRLLNLRTQQQPQLAHPEDQGAPFACIPDNLLYWQSEVHHGRGKSRKARRGHRPRKTQKTLRHRGRL